MLVLQSNVSLSRNVSVAQSACLCRKPNKTERKKEIYFTVVHGILMWMVEVSSPKQSLVGHYPMYTVSTDFKSFI